MHWSTFLVVIIIAESTASKSLTERCFTNSSDNSCAAQLKVPSHRIFSKSSCRLKNVSNCMNQDLGSPGGDPRIGDVSINLIYEPYDNLSNHNQMLTILNLNFTNISWKSMKIRIRNNALASKHHCREFELTNEVLSEKAVIFHNDCSWLHSNFFNETYQLEYEANGLNGSKRGRIHFIVQNVSTLVTSNDWPQHRRPFLSVEEDEFSLILHIQRNLKNNTSTKYEVESYEIMGGDVRMLISRDIIEANDKRNVIIPRIPGSYVFTVLPRSPLCINETCELVQSAVVLINDRRTICIVSIMAVVVSCLFACYLSMNLIRKYLLIEKHPTYKAPPNPNQVLIVHENTHKHHQECVDSLVKNLREDFQ